MENVFDAQSLMTTSIDIKCHSAISVCNALYGDPVLAGIWREMDTPKVIDISNLPLGGCGHFIVDPLEIFHVLIRGKDNLVVCTVMTLPHLLDAVLSFHKHIILHLLLSIEIFT